MPLDARKAAHILSVTNRTFQGRQRAVVFVYQASGVYSYVAINVVFRQQAVIDPQVPSVSGGSPGLQADAVIIAPVGTNVSGLVYIALTDTATSSAVAAAEKYEPIEVLNEGMIAGGSRNRILLRRFR